MASNYKALPKHIFDILKFVLVLSSPFVLQFLHHRMRCFAIPMDNMSLLNIVVKTGNLCVQGQTVTEVQADREDGEVSHLDADIFYFYPNSNSIDTSYAKYN